MSSWTEQHIKDRLEEAARTLKRLPEERVQGYFSTWPPIQRDAVEILQMEPEFRLGPPMPEDIDDMEEVLFVWLKWLEPMERRLVWLRAERVRWKVICVKFGVGRTKAWEMYGAALGKILQRLNEKR
jgi:hypothetical protein